MIIDKKKPNPFDLGFFTNIALFFNYDTFWWWLPLVNNSANDGTSYPMKPPVRRGEVPITDQLETPIPKSIE